MNALETEEHLILAGVTESGDTLDEASAGDCSTFPARPAARLPSRPLLVPASDGCTARRQSELAGRQCPRRTANGSTPRWTSSTAGPRTAATSLKADLEELDQSIKDAKKSARLAPNLPEKLEIQRKLRGLETKRDEAWRAYDAASRDVDRQKDALLDEISRRLQQQTTCETLFSLRWRVT